MKHCVELGTVQEMVFPPVIQEWSVESVHLDTRVGCEACREWVVPVDGDVKDEFWTAVQFEQG